MLKHVVYSHSNLSSINLLSINAEIHIHAQDSVTKNVWCVQVAWKVKCLKEKYIKNLLTFQNPVHRER